jgi:hypothetical protein
MSRPAIGAVANMARPETKIVSPNGELLKLGIDIGQTSVAKYMAQRRGPPSQGWRTFLRNHADGISAVCLSGTLR